MKRKWLTIGGITLGLALVLYLGLSFFLGSLVKAGVNTLGPRLTGTKVELQGASLSPFDGTGTLTGLTVGNPPGWSSGEAFSVGRVHVDLEPASIFRDCVVINEITIDRPKFVYETHIISSNIKDLLNHIEASTSGGETAGTKGERPRKFIVKKFRLTGGTAALGVGPAALPLPLPPIALDNLGVDEGGITAGQFTGRIMRSVLTSIVAASAQAATRAGATTGAAAADAAGQAAEKVGEGIKKLFGK